MWCIGPVNATCPGLSTLAGLGWPDSLAIPSNKVDTMWQRLMFFFTFWDSRFEDLKPHNWKGILYRDFSAGLITAMTAIPMAMGFAMAMGLKPEQGIIAGAIACLVGRTFGGSKYQVYGPTAAFIPIIASLIALYDHGFLVLVSLIA